MNESIFHLIVKIISVMMLLLLIAWLLDPFVSINLLDVAFGFFMIGIGVLIMFVMIYPEDNKTTTTNSLNHIIQEGVHDDDDGDEPDIRVKNAVEL